MYTISSVPLTVESLIPDGVVSLWHPSPTAEKSSKQNEIKPACNCTKKRNNCNPDSATTIIIF